MSGNIFLNPGAGISLTQAQIQADSFSGSDCTGSDKTTNRTLNVGDSIGLVDVERKVLHPDEDYTVSNNIITFLIRIDNRHRITVFR